MPKRPFVVGWRRGGRVFGPHYVGHVNLTMCRIHIPRQSDGTTLLVEVSDLPICAACTQVWEQQEQTALGVKEGHVPAEVYQKASVA